MQPKIAMTYLSVPMSDYRLSGIVGIVERKLAEKLALISRRLAAEQGSIANKVIPYNLLSDDSFCTTWLPV